MKLLLISLMLLLLSIGCKKTIAEIDKLPPITQTGANTFGCLINGVACLPDNGQSVFADAALKGNYDPDPNGQFGIQCNYNKGINTIIIGLDSVWTYKEYLANDSINKNIRIALLNTKLFNVCRWVGNTDPFKKVTGKVRVSRADLSAGIFSGTFNFKIETDSCGTFDVTDGRFDYKF